MIKVYEFDYDMGEGEAYFTVDTDVFTPELANETLKFFSWDYDKENDPVDEVMIKYAMEAIRVATRYMCNVIGVIEDFNNKEGYASIDGRFGITLTSVEYYEFEESKLEVNVLSKGD